MNKTIKPIRELGDVISTEQARAEFEGHVPPKPDGKPEGPKEPETEEGFLKLENIRCVDTTDPIFEKYKWVLVSKDRERELNLQNPEKANVLDAITELEQKGLVLPSSALVCNIIAKLYHKRVVGKTEGRHILDQYGGKRGKNQFVLNTGIVYGTHITEVCHYKENFRRLPGTSNSPSQIRLQAPTMQQKQQKSTTMLSLDQAISEYPIFMKYLTGLENPYVLNKVANYYGVGATVFLRADTPNSSNLCTVSIGYHETFGFTIDATTEGR